MSFADLITDADAVVLDMLGDKTVSITRDGQAIATDISAIYERDLQELDANGLVNYYSNGFTINKADLSVDTLKESDEINDGQKTWKVRKPLAEDQSIITVVVA